MCEPDTMSASLTKRSCIARKYSTALVIALLVLGAPGTLFLYGNEQADRARVEQYLEHLRTVLPEADHFVSKDGEYPHFRGYTHGTGDDVGTLVGLAYLNSDVGHVITGYASEIVVMVGLRPVGTITAVTVVTHDEPYGYRSIDLARFRDQFPNRRYRERLRVGDDVDGISGATITVSAATSAIRRSTRRMFREFVKEQIEAQP